jgi:hypothetical protein
MNLSEKDCDVFHKLTDDSVFIEEYTILPVNTIDAFFRLFSAYAVASHVLCDQKDKKRTRGVVSLPCHKFMRQRVKICLPILLIWGRDQIHFEVAVAGLK